MSNNILQQARELVAEDFDAVERLMTQALTSRAETITRVSRHLLATGGKRVRVLLCLLAGHATGAPLSVVRRLAACAELLHAASLCHDDVLDSGEVRRGQPTIRALFGNPMSILLGDYCLAQAFCLLAEAGLDEAGAAAARVVTTMAEGEVLQAQRPQGEYDEIDRYFAVAEAKTGALLIWCTGLGGLAPRSYLGALETYGRLLGRVYQVADDLLDFDADERSGKRAGQDLCGGENTLPLLLACSARPDLRLRIEALRTATDLDETEIISLTEAIRSTGAFEQARSRALAEADSAIAALQDLQASEYRTALGDLARFAAERHV